MLAARPNGKPAASTTFGRPSVGGFLLLLLTILVAATLSGALENGLARRPPMGWLAWTRFACQVDCQRYPNDCINAALFRQMADRLADDGWLARGYDYVHIDDCWSELQRDSSDERLVADARRFSAGIKALADYVHKHDKLKLGIYGDCGSSTCAGYPGQLRHNHTLGLLRPALGAGERLAVDARQPLDASGAQAEFIVNESSYFKLDAQTLADWHVDSLKFDGCYVDPWRAQHICSKMAGALEATKRPVLLICEWPFYMMYAHAEPDFELTAASCNVWRYYDDIFDSWLSVLNTIDYTVKHQATILKYHGPGHWFDPDQLVIGNFGLSVAQSRAQMAVWCVWAAPLYMSNDLRSIRRQFVSILQNEHLIAINQDKLGVFGQMVAQKEANQIQAFVKPILPVRNGCPSFALVYFNRKSLGNREKVSFQVADLLLRAPLRQAAVNQAAVRHYEATNGSGEKAAELSLETLFNASGQVESEPWDETIEPDACFRRLEKAAEKSAHGAPIEFELTDLMDAQEQRATIGAHQTLELLVNPNDVRAVKLVERV